ncbi:glycosyltransferase family 2 protein [Enterobacter hormaechei]
MQDNIVTILLPVYNAERYIDECISSIRTQTYHSLEIIIINDGSTDNSEKIILKHVEQDSRIKYIKQENSGLISTLNIGLKLATGKYIARMDADDICLPVRIEVQVKHMEKTNADVCGGNYYEIDERGHFERERYVPIDDSVLFSALILRVPFAHPTVMFRSDFLIKNNITYSKSRKLYAEDLDLWYRLHRLGAKFHNVNEFLIKYRVLQGSLSRLNQKGIFYDSMRITSDFYFENNERIIEQLKKISRDKKFNVEEENIILAFVYRNILFKWDFSLLYLTEKIKLINKVKSLLRELKHYRYRLKFKGNN